MDNLFWPIFGYGVAAIVGVALFVLLLVQVFSRLFTSSKKKSHTYPASKLRRMRLAAIIVSTVWFILLCSTILVGNSFFNFPRWVDGVGHVETDWPYNLERILLVVTGFAAVILWTLYKRKRS